MGVTFACSQNGLFSVLYHGRVQSEVGVMCSTASGGTERVSVEPGNYSLSHFPKVKLPDQRNRNRLHAMAFKEYPLWWMLGSSEGLSQT